MLSILPDSSKGVVRCNHSEIRRPTRCRGCGEFVCNKCGGKGEPGGCRTVYNPQTRTAQFGCGRRVSSDMCPSGKGCTNPRCRQCDHGNERFRYAYRPEHPNISGGPTPCEACICGLWARNTCPRCHGEGQADGFCCCDMLISERYCPERCKRHSVNVKSCGKCQSHSSCTRCRSTKRLYAHKKVHIDESHSSDADGFCKNCYDVAVEAWRISVKSLNGERE